jgi:hypothetical protein
MLARIVSGAVHFCISLRQHDDMLPRSCRMRPTSPLTFAVHPHPPQPAQQALGPASDSSTASAAEGKPDDTSGRNSEGAPREAVDAAKCRRGCTANRCDRRASKPAT